MAGESRGPVVVAVGHESNGQALDWAAAEAAAQGCRLHVVHAERVRWTAEPWGLVPVVDFSPGRVTAEDVLLPAVHRALGVAPHLEVSAESGLGSVAPLLAALGGSAQLVVLGRSDAPFAGGLRSPLSTCERVAARTTCPVVVVRSLRSTPPSGRSPRVVVGVDRPRESVAALGIAFSAAAQRGVPVTAVHVWTPDVPADHEAVCGPWAASEERARRHLAQALEPWRSRFSDVPVETRVLVGDPAAALIRESDGAALVVVGRRPRGALRTALTASVGRDLALRAHCPVVVVPAARVRSDQPSVRRGGGGRPDPADPEDAWQRRTPWQ